MFRTRIARNLLIVGAMSGLEIPYVVDDDESKKTMNPVANLVGNFIYIGI